MFVKKEEFKPIERERTSRLVENQIKEAIFKKGVPIGTKLPTEREFADMFRVSRTSVREAVRSLERSGLISIRKGAQGGAFISGGLSGHVVESLIDMFESGEASLEEILEARLIIEPYVAAEVARKTTPEDIERLKETNRLLREGYKTGDPRTENNPRIHRVIGEMSDNRVIQMVMRVLVTVHRERMSNIKLDDKAKKEILRQHEGIIEAMVKKDPELAFQRMKAHILRVHEIHKDIEQRSRPSPSGNQND